VRWWRLSRVSWKLRWRSPPESCQLVGLERTDKKAKRQGTAVSKKYQRSSVKDTAGLRVSVPEQVTVVMLTLVACSHLRRTVWSVIRA